MFKFTFVVIFCVQAFARPSIDYPIESHIVGGTPAKEGQFPFIVSLRDMDNEARGHCGGALISDRYILTAGHCVMGHPSSVGIGVGSVNLTLQKVYEVDKIISHPPSNISGLFDDIALVRVSSPIALGGNVQTIPLYSKNDQLEDKMVTEMGWGYTSINGPPSTVLLYLKERPIISNEACQKGVGPNRPIYPGYVCTKGEKKFGICYEDSGSPLVYKAADGKAYVVGVAVWGVQCARGYPDVYTRVPYYINWIKENMK